MAILKTLYQADNFSQNSILYELTVTSDEDVNATNINTVLPNNGTRYGTVDGISFIPTGSSATIYCPNCMIVSIFIAELGTEDFNTGYKTGIWKILVSKGWDA